MAVRVIWQGQGGRDTETNERIVEYDAMYNLGVYTQVPKRFHIIITTRCRNTEFGEKVLTQRATL